jgi:hypothetical protein
VADPVAEFAAHLGLDVDEKQWAKGDSAIAQLQGAMTRAVAAGQLMATGIQKAAGIAVDVVRGVAETLISWGEQTLETTGHLADLSQQTGLSAEALQEYGYAAMGSGLNTDDFGESVMKLSRTLGEAASGSKDATKALHAAGLTSKAIKAALSSQDGLDAALMEIADRFADMPDGAKKTALAMQVFGRSGARLIPVLNQGGDGIRELRKEAQDLGIVMTNETVAAGDELGDNIDKLKATWGGLKNQLVSALFPTLKQGVDRILAWVKANKELLSQKVHEIADKIAAGIGKIGEAIQYVIDNRESIMSALNAILDVASAIGKIFVAVINSVKAIAGWLGRIVGKVLELIGLGDTGVTIEEQQARANAEQRRANAAKYYPGSEAARQAAGPKPALTLPSTAPNATYTAAPVPAGASAAGAQVNVTAPITVNAGPGMDEEKIAMHVNDTLAAKIRQAMAVKQ